MMGLDTTFLVQLEIQEAEAHDTALEVLRGRILGRDRTAALTPQVLSEFVHVVTDARRFERPLSMVQALAMANFWWSANARDYRVFGVFEVIEIRGRDVRIQHPERP